MNELKFLPDHPDMPQNSNGQVTEDNSEVKTSLSDKELRAKERAITSEYADRQFQIFDVRSFFQELVKESRPAPSPAALTRLLELFEVLENKDEQKLCFMTRAQFNSFSKLREKASNFALRSCALI